MLETQLLQNLRKYWEMILVLIWLLKAKWTHPHACFKVYPTPHPYELKKIIIEHTAYVVQGN